ncbi:M28 family peptidase [Lacinutrix sp.]|uniref:M28 family peptidase n=1 Tax=Lacinutrix sp. TaxID=1937692 RepID=UPI0025C0723A|nr:M28 family peptidase [Lacinutrix sp.]
MKNSLSILLMCSFQFIYSQTSDSLKIKEHLIKITKTEKARNYKNIATLNQVASYIYNEFNTYADSTYYQKFKANGKTYKNVICSFGSHNLQTIVIGAHYDVCGDQEGADDNASGVTGLLELARLLKDKTLKYKIEIVAYTLEEPPFFRTKYMGSYIHAKSLKNKKTNVYGMISLEMIGYFDDAEHSQEYPRNDLSKFYGNKGNYISIVNKLKKGTFARKFSTLFIKKRHIETKEISIPQSITGVDFSDHLNYWSFDYSALMITDTAFYRNKNYHNSSDTVKTLNITKMTQVINTVYETLTELE